MSLLTRICARQNMVCPKHAVDGISSAFDVMPSLLTFHGRKRLTRFHFAPFLVLDRLVPLVSAGLEP